MSKTFTSRPAVTQGRGRGTRSTAQTQTNTRKTRGTATVSWEYDFYFQFGMNFLLEILVIFAQNILLVIHQ